ncbi:MULTISPECIES: GNAT family N-acetyltransferase [Streptococcus]|uniref:GNAT family N-acetyltransferase n=1 Tax=Streptococcus TaxID=1301 RepID=UPI0001F6019F|nr:MULTISPECIES: GNAT family N-acetyltransferase [Streptococcus]EFW07061.1 acetyltransferase [Streptococcus anginosus 1_2_62CV]MBF7051466.1 GNAT family N-acetyltransferase [Streptococcus sp. HF-2466]MCW1066281.1 GNAT family N-acetyltransferase [Streptococcus anginosus]
MSLTSQIITAEFPDLEKVEQLNTEAFPEEERAPLSELLRYGDGEYSHFFAFYDGDEFVGFAFSVYNERAFYISFFAIMPHLRSHGYGGKIIDKLVDFYQRTMVLEVERLDEPCDNLEQRKARMDFYQRNGFRSSHAYLEYDGLSFEILYKGPFFDEEAYRDIFKKIQEDGYFEFEIKHGHGRDWE